MLFGETKLPLPPDSSDGKVNEVDLCLTRSIAKDGFYTSMIYKAEIVMQQSFEYIDFSMLTMYLTVK